MAKLTDDADYDAGETFENVLVRRMASLTDDADYDAGETSENVQVHCLMLGIMTTTVAEDFGLGAFY
ncbi:unnamed protein product [Protopolystoma xenopodis]|uniref:Uncharacterized protein n=1 Tax=Protopolystoma xenopodis TaxID=117903 RepID=A0A3S5BZH1_9PLAT|nr:unnamed protein product [Protopolystoma xenopodis]